MHFPQIFFSPAAVLTVLTRNQAFHSGSLFCWREMGTRCSRGRKEGGQEFSYQNISLFVYGCTHKTYVENWKLICPYPVTEGKG